MCIRDSAYPVHTATTLVGKEKYPSLEEIRNALSKICAVEMENFQKEADKINPRTLGVLMLGFAYGKGLIPLKKESIIEGIQETLKPKLWDINIKAFERGIELAR